MDVCQPVKRERPGDLQTVTKTAACLSPITGLAGEAHEVYDGAYVGGGRVERGHHPQ